MNSRKKRILGYDLARAAAILGMVIVNFKLAMGVEKDGPGWLVGLANLLDRRAAAVFVITAGVGLSLLSQKARLSGDDGQIKAKRNLLLRRALFLFGVGLAWLPLWPADILHYYGVYIAICAWLLTAPDKWLWRLALLAMVGWLVLAFVIDYEAGWNFDDIEYTDLWTLEGALRNLFYNGFHPVLPWVAFVLIGMWLGRQDVGDPVLRRRLLAWSVGVMLLIEGLSSGLVALAKQDPGDLSPDDIEALFGAAPMMPTPLYVVAASATAIAFMMLCLEVGERWGERLMPLVHTGQLALTLYAAHVFIGFGVLESIGALDHGGGYDLAGAIGFALAFFVGGVWFTTWWRGRHRLGPLEWAMRRLTG